MVSGRYVLEDFSQWQRAVEGKPTYFHSSITHAGWRLVSLESHCNRAPIPGPVTVQADQLEQSLLRNLYPGPRIEAPTLETHDLLLRDWQSLKLLAWETGSHMPVEQALIGCRKFHQKSKGATGTQVDSSGEGNAWLLLGGSSAVCAEAQSRVGCNVGPRHWSCDKRNREKTWHGEQNAESDNKKWRMRRGWLTGPRGDNEQGKDKPSYREAALGNFCFISFFVVLLVKGLNTFMGEV